MANVYVLSCRDIGLDCDFQARGASIEEVMQRSADHGAERHGMKGFGPELFLKMHRSVRTEEEQAPPVPAPASTMALPDDSALTLTVEVADDVQIVHAIGRLDTTTADRFDVRIQQVVTSDKARVLLDLAKVNYVSSAGLRSLLTLLKRVKGLGGSLVLAAVHPRVLDILDIAGFTPMFVMAATPDEALALLQTSR